MASARPTLLPAPTLSLPAMPFMRRARSRLSRRSPSQPPRASRVGALSESEIAQLHPSAPEFYDFVTTAPQAMQDLARVPFNPRLLNAATSRSPRSPTPLASAPTKRCAARSGASSQPHPPRTASDFAPPAPRPQAKPHRARTASAKPSPSARPPDRHSRAGHRARVPAPSPRRRADRQPTPGGASAKSHAARARPRHHFRLEAASAATRDPVLAAAVRTGRLRLPSQADDHRRAVRDRAHRHRCRRFSPRHTPPGILSSAVTAG
jgi:hypothetical protein